MANMGNQGSSFSEQHRGLPQSAGRAATATAPHGSDSRKQEPLSGAMSAVKEKVQDTMSTVADKAENLWDSTKQGVTQAASTVAHTAEDAWGSTTSCMSRYPVATFLTGLGLGVTLALALQNLLETEERRGGRYFPM